MNTPMRPPERSSTPRRVAALALVALAAAAGCADDTLGSVIPVGPAAEGTTHMRIEGALDVGTLGLLKRTIDTARAHSHPRVIIEIDTPGGSIDLMWQIARVLNDAASEDLTFVAWVHDHAVSAGVLIALASDKIYMSPQGTIGSAMPV